jgi:hypothetical protein
MDRLLLVVGERRREFDEPSPILAMLKSDRSVASPKEAQEHGPKAIGEKLKGQCNAAELRGGCRPARLGQLGVDVLGEGLADAAHEVADHAGATDLSQGAGQHVADRYINARCRTALNGLQPVIDAARGA